MLVTAYQHCVFRHRIIVRSTTPLLQLQPKCLLQRPMNSHLDIEYFGWDAFSSGFYFSSQHDQSLTRVIPMA